MHGRVGVGWLLVALIALVAGCSRDSVASAADPSDPDFDAGTCVSPRDGDRIEDLSWSPDGTTLWIVHRGSGPMWMSRLEPETSALETWSISNFAVSPSLTVDGDGAPRWVDAPIEGDPTVLTLVGDAPRLVTTLPHPRFLRLMWVADPDRLVAMEWSASRGDASLITIDPAREPVIVSDAESPKQLLEAVFTPDGLARVTAVGRPNRPPTVNYLDQVGGALLNPDSAASDFEVWADERLVYFQGDSANVRVWDVDADTESVLTKNDVYEFAVSSRGSLAIARFDSGGPRNEVCISSLDTDP